MQVAVIQHLLQADSAGDLGALAETAERACRAGAEVLVVPRLVSIPDDVADATLVERAEACVGAGVTILPLQRAIGGAGAPGASATPLGVTFALDSDEAIDPEVLGVLHASGANAVIVRPGSTSTLQAEAFIELAVAMSESIAGLVIVVDPIGPADAPRAFGGSCVALFGEIVAEAEFEDESEILEFELPEPAVLDELRGGVPEVPLILQQRLARHRGEKLPTAYLADLS